MDEILTFFSTIKSWSCHVSDTESDTRSIRCTPVRPIRDDTWQWYCKGTIIEEIFFIVDAVTIFNGILNVFFFLLFFLKIDTTGQYFPQMFSISTLAKVYCQDPFKVRTWILFYVKTRCLIASHIPLTLMLTLCFSVCWILFLTYNVKQMSHCLKCIRKINLFDVNILPVKYFSLCKKKSWKYISHLHSR